MGRACIHFNCKYCGQQSICLDNALKPEDPLTCTKGHLILLKAEDRNKINIAFRSFIRGRIDVFL